MSHDPGLDGAALPTEAVITLELRVPGYVVVQPGRSATAPAMWRNWIAKLFSGGAAEENPS